jgi:iron complex transport system substrate-binding protein
MKKTTGKSILTGFKLRSQNAFQFILSVIMFFSCFVFCADSSPAAEFPRTITDKSGRTITIKSPPTRIITVGPSVTEVVFSLVPSERIIGVSSASNFPPEVAKKEKIGDIYLNYEKIVALRPDLVVIETSLYPRLPDRLRNLGINTLAIQSDTYGNFLESVVLTGKALGQEEKSKHLLTKLQRNMSLITGRIKSVPMERRPRVFIEIWSSPLMTAGSGTFINYVIEQAGGVNIASDLKGYPQINIETLLVRNPDVVILTCSQREEFMSGRYWRHINAVKYGRVYNINPDILVRPTLRLFEGCRTVYNWLYPEMQISVN